MAMYNSIFTGGEIDKGVGRSYVPTLQSAPTTSTLTFTLESNTIDFEIGQMCRVADQNEATGYKFYQLYDITESGNVKTAHWQEAGGGKSILGRITVDLEAYINNAKTAGGELVGVVVTLTNTTDTEVVGTVTIGAGETSAVFDELQPLKAYSISVSAITGYTQPAAQTVAEMPFYGNITKTFMYEADEYTVQIVSNQGSSDAGIANAKVTVLGNDYANNATIKVAKGTDIGTPIASSVTGYSPSVAVSGKTITATYLTEILTIVLASDTGEADLSNVTITVTDTTDSATLSPFATKQYRVPSGHSYSVNVSNDVTGYQAPVDATGTAGSSEYAADTITMTYEEQKNFVDLGLPSGKKWAKGNIISDGNGGYKVGEETDYGAYVSWGNIVPHFSANGSTFDDGYDWGTSNSGPYASTPGKSVSANIPSNDAQHDAALALLGSPWHLPTKEDFQELYNNTDNQWTTINGVAGRKFMKKTDHSVYVFFPAAGNGYGTPLINLGLYGNYWSGSWYSAYNAYYSDFNSSSGNPQKYNVRYCGYSVRAVQ